MIHPLSIFCFQYSKLGVRVIKSKGGTKHALVQEEGKKKQEELSKLQKAQLKEAKAAELKIAESKKTESKKAESKKSESKKAESKKSEPASKKRKASALEAEAEESDYSGLEESDAEMGNSDGESSAEDTIEKTNEEIQVELKTAKARVEEVRKKQQGKQTKSSLSQEAPATERGVIYLGHIPYGFFEPQMTNFFSQFGDVTNLRLARSSKTGASKHFAFVEFADAEVAPIVAEAMQGYMMFGRTLKCEVVPAHKVHKHLFSQKKTKVNRTRAQKNAQTQFNKPRDANAVAKRQKRLLKKESKQRAKLAASGIDFAFPGYAVSVSNLIILIVCLFINLITYFIDTNLSVNLSSNLAK
jgi:nucleolar protein 15